MRPGLYKRIGKLGCQLIAALVVIVAVMTLDPDKFNPVLLCERKEFLPKIGILQLVAPSSPAVLAPGVYPPFVEGVNEIFGVGIKSNVARLLQGRKTRYCSKQLHSVVGRFPLAARKLLFVFTVDEDRAPAAPTGISAARAVRVYLNLFHFFPFAAERSLCRAVFFAEHKRRAGESANSACSIGSRCCFRSAKACAQINMIFKEGAVAINSPLGYFRKQEHLANSKCQ